MNFLSNSAINRANIHSMIQALAQGAGGLFVLVFLLRSGVPTPLVLCTMAGMNTGRFLLRGAVLPLARRLGLRNALILGAIMEAAIFPMLPYVHGPHLMLVLVIVVSSAGSVVYWTAYHALFAALGDFEHLGGQIGAREALTALAGIIAPALGGWALTTAGPQIAFDAVAVVQALSAAPLIGVPNVQVVEEAPGGFRSALPAAALCATDGWFAACFYFVWQIALFVALNERYASFGGAMALAGVLSAAGSLAIGRLIDLGHGPRSVFFAYGFAAIVLLLKAASLAVAWVAVLANAMGAMAAAFLIPVLMARVYDLAKRSPCPLRFNIATEAGWDLGCGAGCLAAAGLSSANLPLSAPMLLGLLGVGAAAVMLLASYREKAASALNG